MGIIEKPSDAPLQENGTMSIPAMFIPSFRTCLAVQRNVEENILIYACGGLGDIVCAEPSIRYAINNFHNSDISVATDCPELYRHLPLKKVYNLKKEKPKWEDYYVFKSIFDPGELAGEFIAHIVTQNVDNISLNLFRCQIPSKDRCIYLKPSIEDYDRVEGLITSNDIVIHPGRSWPSKTFPISWWNKVTSEIISLGARPVLIGGPAKGTERGTQNVEVKGCLDLRCRYSLMQTTAILHNTRVVLTNDSAPHHMATSGAAWIGFISTAKNPDYITHWRNGGEWGWRMKNHSLGGIWETLNTCPNNPKETRLDIVDSKLLRTWLPSPRDYAAWAVEKLHAAL